MLMQKKCRSRFRVFFILLKDLSYIKYIDTRKMQNFIEDTREYERYYIRDLYKALTTILYDFIPLKLTPWEKSFAKQQYKMLSDDMNRHNKTFSYKQMKILERICDKEGMRINIMSTTKLPEDFHTISWK
jgi:hypothetical protein